MGGMDFWTAFSMITAKIFPLLILPCLFSWMVRYMAPRLHKWFLSFPDLPFYLWGVALTLAIAVTTKAIVHSSLGLGLILIISLISLVCCVLQFSLGRYIGSQYRPRRSSIQAELRGKEIRKITAGQSLGQKNTVFAIWMAYTFMTPETAIVGGLYSIWHNIYNSWQLKNKK
jgi:BASS family bile acid:Na+ symporter